MYLVSHLEMFACNLLGINIGLGINEPPLSPLTYLRMILVLIVCVIYLLNLFNQMRKLEGIIVE